MRQEKQKRGEERKRKVEVKTAVSNPKFLLSTHARTSQANILHLDQRAAKCTTCKRLCGNFQLFIARQCPESHSTSFKRRFPAKSPGANGLKSTGRNISCWQHSQITQSRPNQNFTHSSLHNRRFMNQARQRRYFSLRTKCRVRRAWLIKPLLCRLCAF